MPDTFPDDHPSLERLLRRHLPAATDVVPALPIYRSPIAGGILYRCPLYLLLTKSEEAPSLKAGAALTPERLAPPLLAPPLEKVTLSTGGWLEVFLDDGDLSLWLQGFRASFDRFFPYHPPRERDPRFFFLFQYTHARCRALLRLGEREGILLDEEDSPSRFPLSPFHPAERALFWQLLTVVDRAGTGKALSLARDFCESILDLDRFCRIVGEPAAVARSRLRLISASQRLLRVFLAERLAQVPREDL